VSANLSESALDGRVQKRKIDGKSWVWDSNTELENALCDEKGMKIISLSWLMY